MSDASAGTLEVVLGDRKPAEACANCEAFTPSNRLVAVVDLAKESEVIAEGAACEVCLEHYGPDGVAARLWPSVCDWVPMRVFEDCQCETCTGQIEFRIRAGTDFYD